MGQGTIRMSDSDTLERTDSLEDVEADFAKICTVAGDCENEAKWMVWAMHAAAMCPFDGYACDEHKKVAEDYWIHIAGCGKHTCARCVVRIAIGQLSKYFRAIRL